MGWRGSRDFTAILVALLVLLALATAKSRDSALYPAKPGQGVVIYLVDNGFHSDLVLPTALVEARSGPLSAATREAPAAPWIMVGWGDQRFYEATSPWQDRILDGLRAALGGRPTVVHLESVPAEPSRLWRKGIRRIVLSPAGLAALMARADRAFKLGPDGRPIEEAVPGRLPGEAFFTSGEDFSLVHLCNHWTAELLNAAGLPVTPVLDTLPAGLGADLELRAGL